MNIKSKKSSRQNLKPLYKLELSLVKPRKHLVTIKRKIKSKKLKLKYKNFILKSKILLIPFVIILICIIIFKLKLNVFTFTHKNIKVNNTTKIESKPFFLKLNNTNKNYSKTLSLKNTIDDLFNSNFKNNTVLIFEPNNYHYECTPGFAKYFVDLGYNVDVILQSFGEDTFCLFEDIKKIKLFIYSNLIQIKKISEKLTLFFKKYDYILVQTIDRERKDLYKQLNFFKMNNTFFIFHNIDTANNMGITRIYNKNRIWGLGNFSYSIQVNPHYFGKIKFKDKNRITKFFITSTVGRNYQNVISVAERLKNEKYNFTIFVSGNCKVFPYNILSENLKDIITFKYKISYSNLYKEIEDSDYIIINLDPNIPYNNIYRTVQSTGSAQLSYGFLKPSIINKEFASFYSMDSDNSFLYNNSNFYEVMREAILLNNEQYKKMQSSLKKLSDKIYNISLGNVRTALYSH